MHLLRHLKNFWQRGRRGWSDEDAWNLDYHLAEVIAGAVRQLRTTGVGHPCMHEDPSKNHECDRDWWEAVLWEIEYGFREYAQADGMLMEDAAGTALERAMPLFVKHFRGLWD